VRESLALSGTTEIIFHVGRCEINNGQTRFDFPEVPVGPQPHAASSQRGKARELAGISWLPRGAVRSMPAGVGESGDCCWVNYPFDASGSPRYHVNETGMMIPRAGARICHKHSDGVIAIWKKWSHCSVPLSCALRLDRLFSHPVDFGN